MNDLSKVMSELEYEIICGLTEGMGIKDMVEFRRFVDEA